MAATDLTAARLREILYCDSEAGVLVWVRSRGRVRSGDRAGSVYTTVDGDRYRRIRIDGRAFLEHRVIWALHHGEWPAADMLIDHLNGDGLDNRIANLRLASAAVNQQNQRRAQSRSKTGFLGVSTGKKKFNAQIWINGRTRYLGTFATPELAHAAYLVAKRDLHPGCTI